MNTRSIFTKLAIAIALLALVATGAIWEVRHVKANAPPGPDRTVGMVGITQGQTMRLNVVNVCPGPEPDQLPPGPCRVIPPWDPDVPPGPCRVLLSFRDANGQPFTDSNGQVIRQMVELQGGQSAFLDLNGDIFAGGISTNGSPARLQLRPVVRVLSGFPPGPCRATMEVFDNTSGRTSVFANFEPPGDPDRGGGQ
jgi:hypothetical protein